MAYNHNLLRQDAAVNPAAKTLPSSAGAVNSASIDLGETPFNSDVEFELETPDLNSTELPNSKTVTYTVGHSTDDSTYATLMTLDAATQTGAGGTGASGAKTRFKLPSDRNRYVRITATGSSGIGDQSGSSFNFRVLFR